MWTHEASRLLTLTGGTETLKYNIFDNAAYTLIWGDGTHGTYNIQATGTGKAQPITYSAAREDRGSRDGLNVLRG